MHKDAANRPAWTKAINAPTSKLDQSPGAGHVGEAISEAAARRDDPGNLESDAGSDRPQRMIEASLGGYSSLGNPIGENLTWTGGAVAIDHSVIAEDRNLVGDAELSVYLHERYAEALGDLVRVDITNLTDVVTGMTYEDMGWKNMPLRDGQFETFQIRGQFFGPNHEEVGGIFERDSIVGAFGATREEME